MGVSSDTLLEHAGNLSWHL
jgi:hypothetical protein